jgi:signal transduction histidine kinase
MEMKTDCHSEQELRLLQLRFVGKILAGFTHEIKNYLAIVKESAGLMDDMIKLGKSVPNDPDQYLEIVRSIEEQIEKAIGHFLYLNRFSHRMDTPLSVFNINETLEELVALLKRFAAQKRISFEFDFQKEIKTVHNSPSMLQFIVFNLLEEKLSLLDEHSKIIIKTSMSNGSVIVRIIPKGELLQKNNVNASSPDEIVDFVIKMLNGTIALDGKETVITLPETAG